MIDLKLIKAIKNQNNDKKSLACHVSVFFSSALHLVILVISIIGLPFTQKKITDSPHIVVDIMPIAQDNNLDTKKNDAKPLKKKDTPKSGAPSAPPLPVEDKKRDQVLKKATHPKPKEAQKQMLKNNEKKATATKSIQDKKHILDQQKISDYESLLKNINTQPSQENNSQNQSNNHSKINDYDQNKALSITTENAIKRQLYGCWSPPAGAKNAKNMAVIVSIKFAPDGSVIDAKHVERGVFAGNQFYNAAVAAAIRAVWKCSPLQIPHQEYDRWKEIEFNFDPSAMIY
jgi:outer membrane biosynthesis protein TonB